MLSSGCHVTLPRAPTRSVHGVPFGYCHYSGVTWAMVPKLLACRPFVQKRIQVYNKQNIKAPYYWKFCGESAGFRVTKDKKCGKRFDAMMSSWLQTRNEFWKIYGQISKRENKFSWIADYSIHNHITDNAHRHSKTTILHALIVDRDIHPQDVNDRFELGHWPEINLGPYHFSLGTHTIIFPCNVNWSDVTKNYINWAAALFYKYNSTQQ